MISTQMLIAMTEAKDAVDRAEGLVEKLKTAMRMIHDHWLCIDEDEQFRAAVGAVMIHYGAGSEEYKRLAWEMKGLQKVSALINAARAGLAVSLESLAVDTESEFKPIGLVDLWRETRSRHDDGQQIARPAA